MCKRGVIQPLFTSSLLQVNKTIPFEMSLFHMQGTDGPPSSYHAELLLRECAAGASGIVRLANMNPEFKIER
jgi:hypothetical protein